MKCNNLCGLQSQLSYDIDDIKYRQKDQQSNIKNIAHSVRNAQQLFVDTQDSMRKTLSKQIVKELESYEKSQTQNITNKIAVARVTFWRSIIVSLYTVFFLI